MSKFNVLSTALALTVTGAAIAAPPFFPTLDGPLDSASFAGKYEGNVLPQNAGLGFVLADPNGIFGTADDPASLGTDAGVNFLKLDTDTNSTANDNYSWRKNDGVGTWNPDDNSALGGYTVEIRARVRANNNGNLGFAIRATDVNSDWYLQLFPNKVDDTFTNFPTASNSDDWHTFRFASYAPSATPPGAQVMKVWRDGVELGNFAQNTNFVGEQLWFGDWISGAAEVNLDIDYLRWDTNGAYSPLPVPEPTTLSLLGVAAMALLRRSRRK